jgi:hypothetical protein
MSTESNRMTMIVKFIYGGESRWEGNLAWVELTQKFINAVDLK